MKLIMTTMKAGKIHVVRELGSRTMPYPVEVKKIELTKSEDLKDDIQFIYEEDNLDKVLLMTLDTDILTYLDRTLRLPVGVFAVEEEDLDQYLAARNITDDTERGEIKATTKVDIASLKLCANTSWANMVTYAPVFKEDTTAYLSEHLSQLIDLTGEITSVDIKRAKRLEKSVKRLKEDRSS